MSSEITPITRNPIRHWSNDDVRYRYFSDDVRFTCKHINKIQSTAIDFMDDDDEDYLYELCSFNISHSYLTAESDRVLEILNAIKKVLGTNTFSEVVRQAKAAN